MVIIEVYADLLKKIERIKGAIIALESEVQQSAESENEQNKAADQHRELLILESMLQHFEKYEAELKEEIYSLEGLPYKIARLKILENKNYKVIAKELGYDYGYIRKFVSINKKNEEC